MEVHSGSSILVKKGLCWVLNNGKSIWHDNWMDEWPIIDKIPQDNRSNIEGTTIINYFIENDKTWKREELKFFLHSHIMDKILTIAIPMTNMSGRLFRNFLLIVNLQQKLLLRLIMIKLFLEQNF